MSNSKDAQILAATATVADAQEAIVRAIALIRAHGTLHDPIDGGMGSAVFGGNNSCSGTGCLVAGGTGGASGIGCVVIGSGTARGIGSIQAAGTVSKEVQQLLLDFVTRVGNAAMSQDLSLL